MAKKFLVGALVLICAYAAILMFFGNTNKPQKNVAPIAASESTEKKPNSPVNSSVIKPLAFQTTDQTSNNEANADNQSQTITQQDVENIINQSVTQQDLEDVVNQYFDEGIKNFNADDLKPTINLADLKIISGANKETAQAYIENLNLIYNQNLQNIDQAISLESDTLNFNSITTAYGKTIEALYKLAVPENLEFIHRDQIVLLSAQKNAFEIAKDYENDPVKAMLAIQAGEEFNQEFLALQNTLANVIQ